MESVTSSRNSGVSRKLRLGPLMESFRCPASIFLPRPGESGKYLPLCGFARLYEGAHPENYAPEGAENVRDVGKN